MSEMIGDRLSGVRRSLAPPRLEIRILSSKKVARAPQ